VRPRTMRILLVDDNPGDRCLVKRMLQLEAKCDVREADNGVAALDLLTRQRFDLMLIDLQMPVMTASKPSTPCGRSPSTARSRSL